MSSKINQLANDVAWGIRDAISGLFKGCWKRWHERPHITATVSFLGFSILWMRKSSSCQWGDRSNRVPWLAKSTNHEGFSFVWIIQVLAEFDSGLCLAKDSVSDYSSMRIWFTRHVRNICLPIRGYKKTRTGYLIKRTSLRFEFEF